MQILVAPDKFKGTMTASEVATAIADGLARAGVASIEIPLADGGDGSVAAAVAAGFTRHTITTQGADGGQASAEFAFDGHTAVVEVANSCGLGTLTDGELRPMTASSYGFGQAIQGALALSPRRVVLALGGSASTDGGAGMLAALGATFHDHTGHPIVPGGGGTLSALASVDASGLQHLAAVEFVVATDVDNPLLHAHGAAAVFGPQKGANDRDVLLLEEGLDHLVHVLESAHPPSKDGEATSAAGAALQRGAGAAGGLGFACLWLGATRVAGADYFLDLLRFDHQLIGCTAIITGEGRIDGQTLSGKLPAVVAARASGRPVHAFVGRNDLTHEESIQLRLQTVVELASLTTEDPNGNAALSIRLLQEASFALGRKLRDNV